MSSTGFRRDIQGLRAIAVVLVVLYHSRVPGFSGGFIGVDVFFVISGFVIASALRREIRRTGTISLRAFYGRRVRRLLPAFAVMAITTLVLINLLLPIGEVQETATATGIAAGLAVSNLYLLRSRNGYFDAGDGSNPFLHTWSLGVEEQFYVLAPLVLVAILWAATRTRWTSRRIAGWAIGAGLAASIILSVSLLAQARTRDAFYHPLSRFWEIGVGVAFALVADRIRIPRPRILAPVALGVIGFATITFNADTPFPGINALLPVFASLALIGTAPSIPSLEAVLSSPVAVWIGDRSYGWYLWHWPFIVIADQLWSPSPLILTTAAGAALAPTYISYRWIEQPFRDRRRHRPSRRLALSFGAASALVMATAIGSHVGAENRWWIDAGSLIDRTGIAYVNGCFGANWNSDPCTFEADRASGQILLLGDSHAASVADGFITAANELGYTVVVVSRCSFVDGVRFSLPECDQQNPDIERLIVDPSTVLVAVAHRSTRYVSPAIAAPNSEDIPLRREDGKPITDHDAAVEAWAAGLGRSRQRLAAHDIPLVSIDVVPEFRHSFNKTIRVVDRTPSPQMITIAELDARRADVIAAEHAVLEPGNWIDPATVLCGDATCESVDADGNWLYFDDSHLNRAGGLALHDLFVRELRRLTAS